MKQLEPKALGLLELRGETAGLKALDAAVKGAEVHAVIARTVCPGNFLLLLTGKVAAVQEAVEVGSSSSNLLQVGKFVIAAVHPAVWPALTGSGPAHPEGGIITLETWGAAAALEAADSIAKDSAISLLRIRLAGGLGGRGLVIGSGTEAYLAEAAQQVGSKLGYQMAACHVIPAPHPRLWELVL